MSKDVTSRPVIAAVVGARGSGKTSAISAIVTCIIKAGLRVGGVIQPGINSADRMERVGYDIRDVATGESRSFAYLAAQPRANGMRYQFDDNAWKWSAGRVAEARQQVQVLVVDELGKIEAEGGGHILALLQDVAPARNDTSSVGKQLWLLTVRAECRDRIEAQLAAFDLVLQATDNGPVSQSEIEEFTQRDATGISITLRCRPKFAHNRGVLAARIYY